MRDNVFDHDGQFQQIVQSATDTSSFEDDDKSGTNINQNIKELITSQINQQKRFYSIEIMPIANDDTLNYDDFPVKPLFTSVTWLSDTKMEAQHMADSPSLKIAASLKRITPIMVHLTLRHLTDANLVDILATNVQNILALRGGK